MVTSVLPSTARNVTRWRISRGISAGRPKMAGSSFSPYLSAKVMTNSISFSGTIFLYVHVVHISRASSSGDRRIHTTDVLPSRKSILATGDVNPLSPHHFIIFSDSDQYFHTSLTGASKTRVSDI